MSSVRSLSDALCRAHRPLRIVRALSWDRSVHRRFLRQGGRELPVVRYPPLGFEPREKIRELQQLRRRIGGRNPAEELLRGFCDQSVLVCRLLAARETKDFYRYSVELFGSPDDGQAESFDDLAIARSWMALLPARRERATLSAARCAARIRAIVRPVLGNVCEVKLSRRIAAYAAAGIRSIAVRTDARFTPRQARALAHHEGLWHVLTAQNGAAQPVLTVLSAGLSRHTEAQEGAGIFAEFVTGNATSDRFRELAERTLAIDRAARGADYPTVWRELASRWGEERACHLAERVFRGGVLTGGAPFTKDAVYQRGFCRVSEFVQGALERRDEDLVLAFFAGKMSLTDTRAARALMEEGLVSPPRFVPAWWEDRERLELTPLGPRVYSRASKTPGTGVPREGR